MTRTSIGHLAPSPIGVKTIPTEQLHPNPHNPRVLFDKKPLAILKESIGKVGILVPLTVYKDSRRKHHVILDGQRRWICAKELELPEIPVNVVNEPSLVQNIVTMFQIHKLREDWELMPTALKLELLMKELKERNDKKLAELTGLDQAVVQRCKKLLDYPKKYQDMMLDPDPEKRVKADFFIELYVVRNDRYVNDFNWYSKNAFTERMLSRYSSGNLKAVTDFRIIKEHVNNARKAGKDVQISRALREFVNDPDLPIDHLQISSASAVAEAVAIRTRIEKLIADLDSLDTEIVYGETALWETLETLLATIRKKLDEAGRRAK
jgi:ParB family transcriptional regulator, chromosome partitioning protein